jgi:hypothetical protein
LLKYSKGGVKMKKYSLIALAALLLVVTGCGGSKNKVTCTATEEEGGIKMTAELVAEFDKDDKLSDATVTYDLGDSTVAKQYCSLFQLMEDEEKGVKVSCSGSKVTISGYANAQSDDDEEVLGMSRDEFIKKMEETEDVKFTCK